MTTATTLLENDNYKIVRVLSSTNPDNDRILIQEKISNETSSCQLHSVIGGFINSLIYQTTM